MRSTNLLCLMALAVQPVASPAAVGGQADARAVHSALCHDATLPPGPAVSEPPTDPVESALVEICGQLGWTIAVSMAVPASLPPTFPTSGVDHVVTYASWRGRGPRDGDRAIVTRHGALVKLETRLIATRRPDEAEVETSFSNFETGASLSLLRNAEGALAGVTLRQGLREGAQPQNFRHRLVRTEDIEEIAGERCTVWLALPMRSEGVTYSACISADGVLLRDTVLYREGGAINERRALSVERRPVAPAEVLPPREVLDWGLWANRTAERHGENYAVTLTGSNRVTGARRRAFLADGVFKADEQGAGDTIISLTIVGGGARLDYHGERPALTLSHASLPSEPGPISRETSEPMGWARQPELLLGERCEWVDAAFGWSDYSRVECRTADGLPLKIEEDNWGPRAQWEVVSLSRGQTPPGGAEPPADLLRWSRWGWPMLDGD